MAEGDELPPDKLKSNTQLNGNNDESILEASTHRIELDLGDDVSRKIDSLRLSNQNIGPSGSGVPDGPRREDNTFSFKHFLRCDSNNYHKKGARPKVYCDGRPISSVLDPDLQQQGRIVPEYSSALPDFVQDHLVIEQCYLGNGTNSNYNLTAQLPDFTPNRNNNRLNLDLNHENNRPRNGNDVAIPLDLPVRPQTGFPLDLPILNRSPPNSGRTPTNEVGVSKSLPDFLSDGAVRTQTTETVSINQSPERETDRLRRELDQTRRQLLEQSRRADAASREVEILRTKELNYMQNLSKALEQAEENLERSNRRATAAENTVLKLKQEIVTLQNEISNLKAENRNYGDEGAAGGPGAFNAPNELHSQRFAQELRNAASTAELSLRQLLTGVDNLRIMAATLENMHRIEERNESFLDLDEDSGPAL